MNNEFESKTDEYNVGTKGYMAPEIIINRGNSDNDEKIDLTDINIQKSCDIFSLSIILWQMLNGYNSKPFEYIASKDDALYKLIINKNYKQFWEYHSQCIFMKYTYERNNIKDLFIKMFEFDPMKRISVENILKHEFIINDYNVVNNNDNEAFQIFMRNAFNNSKNIGSAKSKMINEYESNITTEVTKLVCNYMVYFDASLLFHVNKLYLIII